MAWLICGDSSALGFGETPLLDTSLPATNAAIASPCSPPCFKPLLSFLSTRLVLYLNSRSSWNPAIHLSPPPPSYVASPGCRSGCDYILYCVRPPEYPPTLRPAATSTPIFFLDARKCLSFITRSKSTRRSSKIHLSAFPALSVHLTTVLQTNQH